MTDLEAIALGVIQADGPCTTYQVHQAFLKSPSLFFSGSAGAIYPLVKRMKNRGFVRAEASQTGRRKSELLSLTTAGQAALENWLYAFDMASDGGFDPARARLSLLPELVAVNRQTEYLNKLLRALEDRVVAIDSLVRDGEPFDWARQIERAALVAKTDVIRSWLDRRPSPVIPKERST